MQTADDVAKVRQSGVPFVLIDEMLGAALTPPDATTAPIRTPTPTSRKGFRPSPRWDDDEKVRVRFDRQRAKDLLARSTQILRGAFADVRLGRAVRIEEVTSIVEDVVECVDRTPHTLLEMLRLRKKD